MIENYVQHEYTSWYRSPEAIDVLKLRLKTDKNIEQAVVYFDSRFNPRPFPENYKPMNHIGGTKRLNFFQGKIKVEDSRFLYGFKLFPQKNKPFWYTEKGSTYKIEKEVNKSFFHYPYIREEEIPKYPDWLENAIVYQIFPDRFAKGGSGSHNFSLNEWGAKPTRDSFFGGDLQGIIDKIDYLKELGINAIYLNPLFKSSSNHKYNIDNYYQIDENFGDIDTAKKFVEQAHENNIKVIVDGVFNHTGDKFFAFRDLLENGRKSKYKDWYYATSFPVSKNAINYETFGVDVSSMPRVNLYNEEAKEYFLEVIRYWTEELNIDGWRMDVADEVPAEFWRKARKIIKELDTECYLVGEIWYNSAEWLEGDQFDGVMNYHWRRNILDLLARGRISVRKFSARVQREIFQNPPEMLHKSLSMLDSHDTPRIAHGFRYYPQAKRKKLIKQAIILQFSLPGIPLIFYGNEIGLTGGDDPDCRRCMIWDEKKQDEELYNFYKRIIKFYHETVSLQSGAFREIYTDEIKQLLIFSRIKADNKCVVAANISSDKKVIKQEFLLNKKKYNKEVNNYFSLLNKEYDFTKDDIVLPPDEILLIQI